VWRWFLLAGLVVLAIFVLTPGIASGDTGTDVSDDSDEGSPGASSNDGGLLTQPYVNAASDPKTVQLAQAIALAEGFNVAGSVPNRGNNPGDLTVSFGYPTAGTLNSAGVLKFNSASDGWNALYQQVANMLYGGSAIYSPAMTFLQVAEKWTGGDNPTAWATIVAGELGLATNNTLADYLNS
jgi:hypothetical protein